jgi:predicted nicotinamide N-methyase
VSHPVASAFPNLPGDPDELPAIPGGWRCEHFQLGETSLQLMRPVNPDLFLDDVQVHAENARHDYMPYWAFLWPSAAQLAQAILERAEWPPGTPVLELGAGLGLVGLAALRRGDRVTFSDYDHTALHLCRLNARLNGLVDPELLFLDWRSPPARQFPVIIGCEVTYDAQLHAPLLSALQQLLAPGGVIWLADPGRYRTQFFCEAARQAGFDVQLSDAAGRPVDRPSETAFQILRLSRAP